MKVDRSLIFALLGLFAGVTTLILGIVAWVHCDSLPELSTLLPRGVTMR